MSKSIFVTGVAASGKSALCGELQKRGLNSYDIEKIPGLFQMVHEDTGKVADRFDGGNLELARQHKWICNIDKLKALIKSNSSDNTYYCGIASNFDDIIPMFDKVFLLIADEKETRERLTNRTSNDYGRTPEVQDWIFTWKKDYEDYIRNQGAEAIDANQPLEKVADEIITKSNA